MIGYLTRRAISLVLTLVVASLVIFFAMEVIPGDPAAFMLGLNATEEAIAALRAQLGLDQGLVARYFTWVTGFFTGDFGTSYTYRVPVGELIAARLAVSAPLTIYALILTVVIAFPVGLLAATRRGTFWDGGIMALTQLGIAVPNFWVGILLVAWLALGLGWFPAGGFPGWEAGLWAVIVSLTLPAVSLALFQGSILARVMRSSVIETLDQDYIRTARAKGLSQRQSVLGHALRNAMIPVMTILGLQFSFLLAGAIIIENVFFLPGLGRLIFQAITQRDLIVVESAVMLLVAAVVIVNFLVDVAYALIDPRLRRQV
ncbi:MAG: ABC transporter permease [Pseudomonadota bacterium]